MPNRRAIQPSAETSTPACTARAEAPVGAVQIAASVGDRADSGEISMHPPTLSRIHPCSRPAHAAWFVNAASSPKPGSKPSRSDGQPRLRQMTSRCLEKARQRDAEHLRRSEIGFRRALAGGSPAAMCDLRMALQPRVSLQLAHEVPEKKAWESCSAGDTLRGSIHCGSEHETLFDTLCSMELAMSQTLAPLLVFQQSLPEVQGSCPVAAQSRPGAEQLEGVQCEQQHDHKQLKAASQNDPIANMISAKPMKRTDRVQSAAQRRNASDAQKSIDNETIIAARRRRSAAEQIWRAPAVSRFMPTSGRNVWASKSGRIPAISQANLMNQRHINRSGLQRACTLRAPCPDLWESLFSADDADIHLWNKMPSQPVPTHDPQGAV